MILRIGSKNQSLGSRVQGSSPGKGFTLIEVLLAVSILTVGLVGVLRVYATSTNAMEKIQYDMDSVFLLKIAMGQIEEKAIIQGDIVPVVSSGEFTSADEEHLGMKRLGRWSWSESLQRVNLPSQKVKRDLANKDLKSDAKKENDFHLNKLKLTVMNFERIPPREVSLETYVRTESAKNS